ncbi:protein of unknown function DUF541 [Desulfofarcimen acetoxidans DSM 771]|uniref:SIMPL domain-containing protein n=1 Tax=Desulfofarcimen acetoxidans (strain ATCC 49208 / DSM 771 / KCTC 5769 / VKM B-1644 / 5575) TaxID=485916 RepID=C8VYF0_DESAS|nr:SIMPL domain-containing protein [Desulfofarcimen acetoxidans]ACV62831.1 protein of unknown function DUF541 [Desulfofarcimen acetoxidans DSM 771]
MNFSEGEKKILYAVIILAVSLVLCSFIIAGGIKDFSGDKNTVTVTGSAKKLIRSDLVLWRGNFSEQSAQLPEAYSKLKESLNKVVGYLKTNGIEEKDIIISAIQTFPLYQMNPNGMQSNLVEGYRLMQYIEIKSNNVEKITELSRSSTELINQGVHFESQQPQYFYTKLNELKVSMLAEAAKDAKNRAESLADNSGSRIGILRSAKMGVFQITQPNSTDVSDMGINDTSSLEKEITAVVNVEFSIK